MRACYPADVGYLALQILGNTAFTMLLKIARQRRLDYLLFGAVNYLVAALVSCVVAARAGVAPAPAAVLLGLVNGAQYQLTFLLIYALLGMTGIAVMSSFLRLAVVVPVVASIAIWGEVPSPLQALGLGLTALALPLLGTAARSTAPPEWHAWRPLALILGTLLLTGVGLLAAKAFAELHAAAQRPVYLSAAFAVATMLSALTLALRRVTTQRRHGGANAAQSPRQHIDGVLGAMESAEGTVAARGGRTTRARHASPLPIRGGPHSPSAATSPLPNPRRPSLVGRQAASGSAETLSRSVPAAGAARRVDGILPALALGVLTGLCNVGQLAAFLRGLAGVPGIVAFPVTAAGGLLAVTIAGRLAWRERVAGRAGAGLALALAAVALVNAG